MTLISENKTGLGAVLLGIAIALYVVGSYTIFPVLFHLYSLILFIPAWLIIGVDFRIAKVLVAPLLAFSLMITISAIVKTIEVDIFYTPSIAFLGESAIFVAFIAHIIRGSKTWNLATSTTYMKYEYDKSCSLCESHILKKPGKFCVSCGSLLSISNLPSIQFDITKFIVLLLITSVLFSFYFPIFSLSNNNVNVTLYTFHGEVNQPFITTPNGWLLNSTNRILDYEEETSSNLAIRYNYVSAVGSANSSGEGALSIFIEISSTLPFLMNKWRISGWTVLREETVSLTEITSGRFVLLEKLDAKIAVIYASTTIMFNTGSFRPVKYVGISVFKSLSYPSSESQIQEAVDQIESVSRRTLDRWESVSVWVNLASAISAIARRTTVILESGRDVFLAVGGSIIIFTLAGWVREKDREVEKRMEQVLSRLRQNPLLILSISKMRREFTGRDLYETYCKLVERRPSLDSFCSQLSSLLKQGLLSKTYTVKKGELKEVWRKTII
jgi:hypothetical protein